MFFDNKGFAKHLHIPSGDDDLFIQEVAPRSTVAIEINNETHTTSAVIESWKEWAYQKRRHITTAPLYKTKFKVLLSLYPYAQLLFWIAIVLLFIFKVPLLFSITLLSIKLFTSYLINYNSMKRLNVMDLYWVHPLYEIAHLLVQGFFVLLNLFKKPKKWRR